MNKSITIIAVALLASFGFAQTPDDLQLKWDCQTCHAASGWSPLASPMKFDHNRETVFPLAGAHLQAACVQCHLGKDIKSLHDFERAPVECSGCHVDYHSGRYGVVCEKCHRSDSWDMNYWNDRHMETLFPLVGSHRGLACNDCHLSGEFFRDTDCVSCHLENFRDNADNPGHENVNERSDCALCHGPTLWNEIMALNHDSVFPINSGNHLGAWDRCSDCHTTSSYQEYNCTNSGCHPQSEMDSEHRGESCDGITYSPTRIDCYHCHPRGNNSKCDD